MLKENYYQYELDQEAGIISTSKTPVIPYTNPNPGANKTVVDIDEIETSKIIPTVSAAIKEYYKANPPKQVLTAAQIKTETQKVVSELAKQQSGQTTNNVPVVEPTPTTKDNTGSWMVFALVILVIYILFKK